MWCCVHQITHHHKQRGKQYDVKKTKRNSNAYIKREFTQFVLWVHHFNESVDEDRKRNKKYPKRVVK